MFILGLSVLLQFFAAFMALRLIPVTGTRIAWVLVASALFMMGVRRSISFYRLVTGDGTHLPDVSVELVALGISLLLVVGIWMIGPLFRTIKESRDVLHRAQDEMEKLVDERTESLRHANELLKAEVAERKRVEADLMHAKEDAELANSAKSRFLSAMSHELRTPMNAILGYGQLLAIEASDTVPESQQEHVREIVKAGRHLLELINEVLDLATIESGQVQVNIEDVVVEDVLDDCCALVAPLAEERKIVVEYNLHGCMAVVVKADYIRLKQVLINLVTNAIKYSYEGDNINLKCEITPGKTARICITDHGPGITVDEQALFEPFNRLGAEESDIEGTGIGLAITKRLVDAMGGKVGVDSIPGKGSTFWVEFDINENYEVKPGVEVREIAKQHAHSKKSGKYTLLYIEDDPTNLKLITSIMKRKPEFEVLTAHSGELGLDLARIHRPDIILIDINLPGMDGYEVLSHLQKYRETRHIPMLAITANASQDDIDRGNKAGFLHYLTKPIEIDVFLNAIDTSIQSMTETA
jgi:signal transduction histidine kinase/ActR/RegA family two-component response regulator